MYQKDGQIEFQEASNHANMPDDAENIYAEPFGHIAGTVVHNTALTPSDNVPRYQNLLGKKLESGEIIYLYIYLLRLHNTVDPLLTANSVQWPSFFS